MEQKNKLISILIVFLFVNLGGIIGIFITKQFVPKDEPKKVVEVIEYVDQEIKEKEAAEKLLQEELAKKKEITSEDVIIDDKKLTVESALENWKHIIMYVEDESISFKDGVDYITNIASKQYLSILPKEFMKLRLNHVKKNPQKGSLQEIKYEYINYKNDKTAYVNMVENYEGLSYAYVLKFVREDGWNFAGQLDLKEINIRKN